MKPNRYTYNPPLIIPKLSNFLDIPDSYKRLKVDDKEYLRLRLEKDSQSLVGGGGRVEGGRPVGAESEEQNEEKLIEITSSSSSSSTPSPIENASYFSTRVDEAIDVLLNLAAGPRHSLSPPISTPVNNPPTTETTKTTTTTTTAAVGAAATIEEEDEVEEDEEEKEDEEEDNPHIYKCQLCPKEFHTRKGLSMHEAVHDKKFEVK